METVEELKRVALRAQPDKDFGPLPGSSRRWVVLKALVDGTSSLVDVWPAFHRRTWRSHPERDRVMLMLDTNIAMRAFVDAHRLAATDFVTAQDHSDTLTPREREILQLLAEGMSNADLARVLSISEETVKSHVRHILAKLGADTSTGEHPGQGSLFDPASVE